VIGLATGFIRRLDAIVMRIMDGLMAIPAILLAIALISLSQSSIRNVIIAITIPEVPRMVRLVRSVVLTLREQLFVDAAVSLGARLPRILTFHIMPNTVAPLIVQATYVCASAIIIEAILSFLGAGTPPDVPSWGNIMAEGRTYVMVAFWILLFPGIFLTLVVLGVNLLGDGLRDTLDPRLRRSTGSIG
jgi:peptide/nickel transport system permease protein